MKEYVVIFASISPEIEQREVLLVLKDRPEWQKGKLNLPGGKIEEGESPVAAAVRELKEETGLDPIGVEPKIMGTIKGQQSLIYSVNIRVPFYTKLSPREGETEVPNWYFWSFIKNDERLMPNLRITIPLMKDEISGWEIKDDGNVVDSKRVISIAM